MGDSETQNTQPAADPGATPDSGAPENFSAYRTKTNGELAVLRKRAEKSDALLAELASKIGETPKTSAPSSSPAKDPAAPLTIETLEARLVEHGRLERELGRLESKVPEHIRAKVQSDLEAMSSAEQVKFLRLLEKSVEGGETPQQQAGGETPASTVSRPPDGPGRSNQAGWPTRESWTQLKMPEKRKWLDRAESDATLLQYLNSVVR